MALRKHDGTVTRWLAVGAVVAGAVTIAGCSSPSVVDVVFGPVAPQAKQIVECESGFRSDAVSRTNDHGLFQINIVHQPNFTKVTGQPWSAVYDPLYNAVYAKWLYDRQGWQPWSCKRVLGL